MSLDSENSTNVTRDVQGLILNHLVSNEEYMRKCIPHLRKEYFERKETQLLFEEISNYIDQCNQAPSKEAILINLSKRDELKNDDLAQKTIALVKSSFQRHDETTSLDWLLDTTEHWCQERAIYNSIIESISIIDGKDKSQRSKHAIPKILQDALSVSFNNYVGHDYLENFEQRFEFYHHKEDRVPFNLELFNRITRGGLPRKTLNVLFGSSGIGKTLILCHFAASYLMQSKNVLYITLEMSEERIAERIDANLMNVPVNDLYKISDPVFRDRVQELSEKTKGRLIIKEYPTGSAHTGHFRALLNELKTKKNFIPEIILLDYLNICSSSRIKAFSGSVNTYSFVKSIAEEVRGLAIEFNLPIISLTQGNRSSFANSDLDATNVADSIGLVQTVDLLLAAIVTDELQQRNQILIKQVKNRYNDPNYYSKFYIGVDRSRMKLYDLEDSAAMVASTEDDDTTPRNHADAITDTHEEDYDFSQFKY